MKGRERKRNKGGGGAVAGTALHGNDVMALVKKKKKKKKRSPACAIKIYEPNNNPRSPQGRTGDIAKVGRRFRASYHETLP